MLLAGARGYGMSPDSLYPRLAAYYSCRPAFYLSITLVITLSLSMLGCAGVSASKSFTSSAPPTVSLSPATVSLQSGVQQQFFATVTNANDDSVNWSASQGDITPTGLYTAPPVSSIETVNVTATTVADASIHAVVTVTIMPPDPLVIESTSFSSTMEGAAYSQTLSASGGMQPYTWNTLSGALPAGFQLDPASGLVSGSTGQNGSFSFSVQVADSSSPPQTASAPFAINVQATGVQRIKAQFFGMHINRRNATFPMPTIPFGAYRTIDSYRTLWNGIETAPGVYDFTTIDSRVADSQAAGVDVLYTIYGTPTFHSSNPTDAGCGVGMGACEPPSDVNADGSGTDASLIAFLTALVNHVGGQIQYYEVWNEANITSEYNGTWPQLVRMAQDARATILSINPNAKILSPSFAELTYNSAAAKEAAYLATSVNGSTGSQAADIINFHGYVVTPALPLPIPEYEVVNLNHLLPLLSAPDLAKPLWDTEWGPGIGLNDPDLNSSFIARHLLIEASQGVVRSYYYDWNPRDQRALWSDTLVACLNGGTTNASGFLCDTGAAFQRVEGWLMGNTSMQPCAGPLPPATGVWTCSLLLPDGKQRLAVWDSSKTCSAAVCTTSTYNYDPLYAQFFTLSSDTSSSLAGGTVSIGVKPILLSQ
jgi:hypothetical protein